MNENNEKSTTGTVRNKALQELIQGVCIYTLCISLPAIIGISIQWYQSARVWVTTNSESEQDRIPHSWTSNFLFTKFYGEHRFTEYYNDAADTICDAFGSFCPPISAQQLKTSGKSQLQNALFWICFFSVLLAFVRICLVYALVPRYLAPRRLAAFMRCKSTHILSAMHSQVSRKPVLDVKVEQEGEEKRGVLSVIRRSFQTTRNTIHRSLGHEDTTPYSTLSTSDQLRMFSAPRYATAFFRLLYSTMSSALALYLFRSAEFWPGSLLGSKPNASTRHCWDLSGGVALLGNLENDFDHYNIPLRWFFILSASYHLQSLCFHLFSMMLLFFYGSGTATAVEDNAPVVLSMKSSMTSYLRPLMEHIVTLLLFTLCFIFSSLRRLGAIGIFALDFSGLFLHMLQVCVNADEVSFLKKRRFVWVVYWLLVLPSFLYCRFYILPFIIWYSAAFESHDWLDQIEHAVVPGLANFLYFAFNALGVIIMGLNLVLFKRLLFHKHIQQILTQDGC